MTDIDARLAIMLATRESSRDPKAFFLDLADLVARDAAEAFGRQIDEVGILMVSQDGTCLRFIASSACSSHCGCWSCRRPAPFAAIP